MRGLYYKNNSKNKDILNIKKRKAEATRAVKHDEHENTVLQGRVVD